MKRKTDGSKIKNVKSDSQLFSLEWTENDWDSQVDKASGTEKVRGSNPSSTGHIGSRQLIAVAPIGNTPELMGLNVVLFQPKFQLEGCRSPPPLRVVDPSGCGIYPLHCTHTSSTNEKPVWDFGSSFMDLVWEKQVKVECGCRKQVIYWDKQVAFELSVALGMPI